MLIPLLFQVLVVACWGYALVYGGATARWAFLPFVFASIGTKLATFVGQSFTRPTMARWEQLNVPLLISDSIYLIGVAVIAYRTRKYWPIWSAGFMLLTVLAHAGPLLDPTSNPRIYRALESVWAVPMLITMVIGIAMDRREGPRAAKR
jgi:hypothetical protein